jgi:hypothetical protein
METAYIPQQKLQIIKKYQIPIYYGNLAKGWCSDNTLTCIQELSSLNLGWETGWLS